MSPCWDQDPVTVGSSCASAWHQRWGIMGAWPWQPGGVCVFSGGHTALLCCQPQLAACGMSLCVLLPSAGSLGIHPTGSLGLDPSVCLALDPAVSPCPGSCFMPGEWFGAGRPQGRAWQPLPTAGAPGALSWLRGLLPPQNVPLDQRQAHCFVPCLDRFRGSAHHGSLLLCQLSSGTAEEGSSGVFVVQTCTMGGCRRSPRSLSGFCSPDQTFPPWWPAGFGTASSSHGEKEISCLAHDHVSCWLRVFVPRVVAAGGQCSLQQGSSNLGFLLRWSAGLKPSAEEAEV